MKVKIFIGIIILGLAGIGIYISGFNKGEIVGEVNTNPNEKFISNKEAEVMDECEAVNLEKKEYQNLTLKIGKIEEIENTKLKKEYTLDELQNLGYGVFIESPSNEKPLYLKTEICQGDKTKSYTDLGLDDSDTEGSFGSLTQFNNEQADGLVDETIDKPGNYTLYTYASTDGTHWTIAKSFEFIVK